MTNGNDKSLESWIWDAACSIRGAKDAPKFKDYIRISGMAEIMELIQRFCGGRARFALLDQEHPSVSLAA